MRAADSPSKQGYTPFEGQELTGKVLETYLRGNCVWANGQVRRSLPGGIELRFAVVRPSFWHSGLVFLDAIRERK